MTENQSASENIDEVVESPVEENEKSSTWKKVAAGLLALVLLGSLLGYFFKDEILEDAPAKPIAEGKVIIVPDPVDGGKPNEEFKIGKAVNDKTAPRYEDPADISKYREVDSNGNVFLKAPVEGRCRLNTEDGILPPDNYLHVCYYEKNGAVFYTSHAVIGPRTGALENIQFLKVGQPVTLDGVKYEVTSVSIFPSTKLPNYLFKPGVIGLVTCHIDSSVKSYEDYTKTDIVLLKKV